MRVEVDTSARGAEERLLRRLLGQLVLQLFVQLVAPPLDLLELAAPALPVEVDAGEFEGGQGDDALELQLRGARERVGAKRLDEPGAQGEHERRVARRVFELRRRKLAAPVAHLERLVDGLAQVALGHDGEAVAVFLLARRDELAGEQRVEESAALDLVPDARARVVVAAQLDAEEVSDPLRVEVRVVRDLDGARRREQTAQGFERRVARGISVRRESVEVEEVDRAGRGELHEAHAPLEGRERSRLGVEAHFGVARQLLARRGHVLRLRDEPVVEFFHRCFAPGFNADTARRLPRLILRADQIHDRPLALDARLVHSPRRQVVAVARAERVLLAVNNQSERAAQDPVRLILGVAVRRVVRARAVAPLEDAVAFQLQLPPQAARVGRR